MSNEEKILAAIEHLHKEVSNNAIRTQRIERRLIGDKEYGQNGLVDEVTAHGKYIQRDKLNKKYQKGILAGIAAAFGVLGSLMKQMFTGQ